MRTNFTQTTLTCCIVDAVIILEISKVCIQITIVTRHSRRRRLIRYLSIDLMSTIATASAVQAIIRVIDACLTEVCNKFIADTIMRAICCSV